MMQIIAVSLQLGLIILKWITEIDSDKRKKKKELKDEFRKALKDRDYAKTTYLWSIARRN